MKTMLRTFLRSIAIVSTVALLAGCGSSGELSSYDAVKQAKLEQVRAGKFDSGRMWTFEAAPVDYFQETYNFTATQEWLDDVRLSSLRMSTGCSASFVSGDGLVMTNHHCARGTFASVQKEGENLLKTGFFAETLEDERKIPDVYFEQLRSIRDVTPEIHAAMDAAQTDEDRLKARDNAIKEIQERAEKDSGLRAQVVRLYDGGRFSLYLFKRFSDVRLVLAPELGIAHFGGDHDNFTYPRYCLDFTFVRLYDDDGKPYNPDNFFNWSKAGAKDGEAVFVVGNPGSTSRLSTADQLAYYRDVQYPYISNLLNDRMEVLLLYVEQHPEKKDEMKTQILGISNGQKAYMGRLSGLRDDVLMQRRRDFDRQFRAEVMKRPELKEKYGHVWDEIADTRAKMREVAPDQFGLRANGLGISVHYTKAGQLAAFASQMQKSEEDRAEQFKGNKLDLMKRAIAKGVSTDTDLELLTLERQLKTMVGQLGKDDPVVEMLMKGKNCQDAARALLASTILNDSAKVAALVEGAPESILASRDPFIAAAVMAQPRLEAATEVSRETSARDEVNRSLLGRALYDVYGTAIPPDATFSLRIADGVVKGFDYNGTKAPAFTTFYGLYDRYHSNPGSEDWDLPARWKTPPAGLDLSTPMDIVSTNDIIGGNSGSPMINIEREVVGLVFDGNIESLPGDFIFAEDAGNRTVSVHSAGILEAVRHAFNAERVARELERGRLPAVD
ncbi:MAG: S46 family peptidase [Bacteroidetes bacterium]|nr:S46 family peptidase [Bacteroidota bacterium]